MRGGGAARWWFGGGGLRLNDIPLVMGYANLVVAEEVGFLKFTPVDASFHH